jgi:hypothetical protein
VYLLCALFVALVIYPLVNGFVKVIITDLLDTV